MDALKYAHTFGVIRATCDKCGPETLHTVALQSNRKDFVVSQRVKVCETCRVISPHTAPIGQ